MKTFKKVIQIIITTILILILLFNIYSFINIKILKKDLVTIGGYSILEVVSGSMEPTIKIGDFVVIDTKDKDIKVDDIITFKDENDSLVTHRVISLSDNTMITKGDYNDSNDEEMPTSNIVGTYKFKIGYLGNIIKSLQKPFTSIMIFIIGILICYLISTDDKGNPILEEDEKEFQEFLKNKEKKKEEVIPSKKKQSKKKTKKKKNAKESRWI